MSNGVNENHSSEAKTTEIVEDYLDLIRCSHPYCNCGKCISIKYSHNAPNFPYEKNLKSSYKTEFDLKKLEDKQVNGNTRKPMIPNLGLDNCFKEHIKIGLVSVMKNDYGKSLKFKEDLMMKNLENEELKALNVSKINSDSCVVLTNKLLQKNNNNHYEDTKIKIDKSNNNNFIYNNDQAINLLKENNYTKINNYNRSKKPLNSPRKSSNRTTITYFEKNANNYNNRNNNQNKNKKNSNSKNRQKINSTIIQTNNINDPSNTSIINKNDSTIIKSRPKRLIPPFIGRSSYELMFPDWQTKKIIKEKERANLQQSVPFNGRSSYQDNFHLHEKRYYVERLAPIIKSDNLETSGKFIGDTTTKLSYLPIDFSQFTSLNNGAVKASKRSSSLVSAPYSRDSFLSSYERAFMYNDLKSKVTQMKISKGNNNSVLY